MATPSLEPAHPAEVCRLPQMLRHFVMVDGVPRAGKTTVCRLISSFERVELERIQEIYDYVGYLFSLGKMDRDAAVALLRASADLDIYNLYLGRNVNCRPGDQSGILKSAFPMRYLRRMFAGERENTAERILSEAPILQQHAHYQMERIGIHFDAFPDVLKVIEVLRHPIDLVDAYRGRMAGGNVCESLHRVHLCLRHKDTAVHLMADGWEDEFLSAGPADRVIHMFHGYLTRSLETYRSLPSEQRDRIRIAIFEDLAADPRGQAEELAAFLGTRTTKATARMIARTGSLRPAPADARNKAFESLKSECTPENLTRLDEMIAIYENRWVQ
ncbi:MAG: sulfotransferase domain-containing protein [Rhodospirillales bacterium]